MVSIAGAGRDSLTTRPAVSREPRGGTSSEVRSLSEHTLGLVAIGLLRDEFGLSCVRS